MKQKRILTDPGFWLLAGINLYLVYQYALHPAILTTLLWLYWAQSVMLGIFNLLDILTVKAAKPGSFMVVNKTNVEKEIKRVPAAFIFLIPYCLFHLLYFIGLLVIDSTGPFQPELFWYFLSAFTVGQLITFIQHKIQQWHTKTDIGAMVVTPYVRILPMHIALFLAVYVPAGSVAIFLILKGIADVVMYIITKPKHSSREADTALLASQNMNV